MNHYHANNTFTPMQVQVVKAMHSFAIGLSRMRFMEMAFSLLAVAFGFMTFTVKTSLHPFAFTPWLTFVLNHPQGYGFCVFTAGLAALYGCVFRRYYFRMVSAIVLSLLWAGLAWNFGLAQPPLPTAFVSYSFDSLIEACIFIRVYADLDYYWHGRA